jgi:hypothetical protein
MAKSIGIRLSDVTVHKLELMDINPSQACATLLEWLVNDSNKNVGMLFVIEHTMERIKALEIEIAAVAEKKALLVDIKRELRIMRAAYDDTNDKLEHIDLVNYLNRRIIAYHYDIKEIQAKHKDVIARIKRKNKRFDLRKHINKIRLLREKSLL